MNTENEESSEREEEEKQCFDHVVDTKTKSET